MAKQLKITLVKSVAGRLEKHKACAQVLGLRKIRQSVIREDSPSVRGTINKISYLLEVTEL
jgi:large subunit ribosomal protein L30